MNVHAATRASAERLVVAATMGPTVHDVHAWRFKVVSGLIEVHADPDRYRPKHDPAGRGLHLSSGAALVNLRLAATQLGHEAIVRLLPDAGRPSVLASVRLAGRHRTSREERLLYAATLRPFRAGRTIATSACPPPSVVDELAGEARLEGAVLRRLPPAPHSAGQRAVLTTRGDSPAEWLRAGQALQRLLLGAAGRSLAASFGYETLDMPGAEEVTEPGETPQVLLEITQAGSAPTPAAGRWTGRTTAGRSAARAASPAVP
ncbi:nitroreductase [Actinomadura coerulea]|uniref:Nitroreductase n=1 Tax=Actinomadura coerulea TaxID=46159 RepID=A0A7X0FV86_9ACTN|nr:hypothetical protein [Actinomadura coerulea]MBB6394343.1 nitroreductase [Actinomadura coerulea]GGQ42547.1 hypothetical protein GCM10010187_71370 [Actinomadura coerulea]